MSRAKLHHMADWGGGGLVLADKFTYLKKKKKNAFLLKFLAGFPSRIIFPENHSMGEKKKNDVTFHFQEQ